MMRINNKERIGVRIIAIIAILFGAMTIKEGGSVLFWSEAARTAAGKFVPFVLWFNFLAGFFYVIAGIGLFLRRPWATKLALVIATLTVLVFIAFGVHIASGGGYETRTLIAMTMRSGIWITIAFFAHKLLIRQT